MTPHNSAPRDAFGKTVLMPGDPLRARYIAETYLTEPTLVNNVRGVQGYTGTWRGVRVSVMASGMGMPSIGIYSHELFAEYGVENILRVGTAGGMSTRCRIRDVVLGIGACTNSNFQANFGITGHYAPTADYTLLRTAADLAVARGLKLNVGNLLSSDIFYDDDPKAKEVWEKMGVLAVEMEAAALYMNAARAGKRALCICTISDHLLTGESTSPEERQTSFGDMMTLALDVAVEMENA